MTAVALDIEELMADQDRLEHPVAGRRAVAVSPPTTGIEHAPLWCGCQMEVRRMSGQTRAERRIARRGPACALRMHTIGARIEIWEMLPPPASWRR